MGNHRDDPVCNYCKQEYYLDCFCDKAVAQREKWKREESEAEAFVRKVGKANGKPYVGLYLSSFKEVADLIKVLRPDLT